MSTLPYIERKKVASLPLCHGREEVATFSFQEKEKGRSDHTRPLREREWPPLLWRRERWSPSPSERGTCARREGVATLSYIEEGVGDHPPLYRKEEDGHTLIR